VRDDSVANYPIRLSDPRSNAAISKRVMSVRRGFNPLAAFTPIAAAPRARTAFRRARKWTRHYRPVLPFALLLMSAALVPVPGRTQEPPAPAAESNEAGKPDAEQSAPTPPPAEASPPAEPAPAAVRVPEVVVSAPRPKPARAAPAAPATAPRRVIAAVSPPASPTAAVAPAATQPAAPAASQGKAASDGGPGALPKPPGQTITTVSGERIKDSPAFTVEALLQESPGVNFKQGNGPRDIGISIRGSNARNTFGIRNIVVLEDGFSVTQPDGLSRTDLLDPHVPSTSIAGRRLRCSAITRPAARSISACGAAIRSTERDTGWRAAASVT
jgi:hypothetical protein